MVDMDMLQAMSDLMDKKLEPICHDIGILKKDVAELKKDVANLKVAVSKLETDVSSLKTNMDHMNEKIINIEFKVTKMELTIENETNKNIRIVAEGHLDLYRKLNESVYKANDAYSRYELNEMSINKHEKDIKILYQAVS